MRRTLTTLGIILSVVIVLSGSSAWCGVRAWEGTITIPTYPWEPEDINPKFFALEGSIIYPYTMQDNISTQKEDRVYKALFLENEYLKVTCLPELSGRIYSVLDKTTGEEMFHTNRVVKPGMIAMRGAWISGGIEWNTGPHGHAVTIVTPVNVTYTKNRDGSASLAISNTEQIFRTRWTVYLTLHPGKAYLDERIAIFNPTDGMHPYYFWNCTAFYCLPGTRFIYPMTLGTDHNGTSFYSWPIDKGKDLTWLKNYDRPSSVFAYDCAFDFFGAYDTGLDRGIVQYADHNILIGKKAWTWGQSGDGIVSQRNLHEGDEQYIEVQSGPLLTQADYGLLRPREEVAWQEWWYPVHGLKDGFEYATLDLTVQRLPHDGKLEFRLIPTGRFPNARCEFSQNGKILEKSKLNLSPLAPAIVSLDTDPDAIVDVQITDRDGEVLASYRSPLQIPERTPPEPDWKSAKKEEELSTEETYLKGLLYDKQTNRPLARDWYERALKKDPNHAPSLHGIAILDLEAGLYDSVIERLNRALERDADNGMAWYTLGAAYLMNENPEDARRCAYKSVKTLTTASQGYDLAGRALIQLGQRGKALEAFKNAVQSNPKDNRAQNHYLLALYGAGNRNAAKELAHARTLDDPTDPVPQAVSALMKKNGLIRFAEAMNDCLGEVEFEMVEAASIFAELGLNDEAYRILDALFLEKDRRKTDNPIPYYYLAYYASRSGDWENAKRLLSEVKEIHGDGMFPSRLESIDVLEWAIRVTHGGNDCDARTHLRLGNLYGGLGRLEEAERQWKIAADTHPALSVAWRNLGLMRWKKGNDLSSAQSCYLSAISARPGDQALYRDLARILLADGNRRKAIDLLGSMPQRESRRTDIIEILAQAYVDEKEYTHAIDLLNDSFFSNWENRTVSRNVFVRAHIERGKQRLEKGQVEKALSDFSTALTYPAQLGVGRSANPAEAEPLYWKGKALAEQGKISAAKTAWKQGAESHPPKFRQRCREALQ